MDPGNGGLQAMKMVNHTLAAIFLALAGCSSQTVPDKDDVVAALNAGDLETALKQVKAALAVNPKDPELHFLYGKLAIETGDYELAKGEMSPLLKNPKFAAQAKAYLAQAYLASGNPQIALDTLGAGVPESGLAYAVAVDAHLSLGHGKEGMDLLAKGLAAFPDSSDLLEVQAHVALAGGEMDKARQASAKILSLNSRDTRGHLLAGRIALIDGDPAKAESHFDEALKINSKNQVALLAKAALAHDRGDNKKAEEYLKAAAEIGGSGDIQTKAFMAQMALEAGDAERANKLMQGLPTAATMPYLTMLRGVIAQARGQNEQAVSLLEPYFKQGNENSGARLAISNALLAVGEKQRAWSYLKPLADAANAGPVILGHAANLASELGLPDAGKYQARQQAASRPDPNAKDMVAADKAIGAGDWKAADAIYQRLLSQPGAQGNVILLNNAANVRLALGDKAGAINLASQALAAAPDDPLVNDTLGWAKFKQDGATPEVVALMRKAYAGQPGNPEIRTHLTEISKTLKPIQ